RGRTGEEHRRLQFLDDGPQFLDRGVRGSPRGLEHGLGHPRHRRAQRDSFGDVETTPHAARSDEWQADVRQENRCRGRDSPIPKGGAETFLQARGLFPCAVVFDRRERRAAETANVGSSSGFSNAARCEPTPIATPTSAAAFARLPLISFPMPKPPVIDEMIRGASSRLPKNFTLTSTSSRSISGRAEWTSRTSF